MKKITEKMKSTGMLLAAVLRGAWESPWVSKKTIPRWRGVASVICAVLLSGSLVRLQQESDDLLSTGEAIALAKCVVFYVAYILAFSFMLEVGLKEKMAKLLKIWVVCCGIIIPLTLLENLLAPEAIRHTLMLVNFLMVLLVTAPLLLHSHDTYLKKKQKGEMDRLLSKKRELLRDLEIMEKFSGPCRVDVVLPGMRATGVVVPKSLKDLVSEKLFGRFEDDWPDETEEADNTIYGGIEFGTDCEE